MAAALPPELLTKILINLDSIEIIRVSTVNALWKDLIDKDPSLRRSCFKRPSLRYYDEGCEDVDTARGLNLSHLYNIRFHPAMNRIFYRVGSAISSAHVPTSEKHCQTPLLDLSLKNDFVSIPVVFSVDIEVIPDPSLIDKRRKPSMPYYLPGINLSIENPNGIRIVDIFSSIAVETTQLCDLISYASGGHYSQPLHGGQRPLYFKKADILGKHKLYSGTYNAILENGRVKIKLYTTYTL